MLKRKKKRFVSSVYDSFVFFGGGEGGEVIPLNPCTLYTSMKVLCEKKNARSYGSGAITRTGIRSLSLRVRVRVVTLSASAGYQRTHRVTASVDRCSFAVRPVLGCVKRVPSHETRTHWHVTKTPK